MDVDKIDDDIKLLMVIAPKDITDKAQYAIDQFIMRGGKLMAFLDAQCLADNRQQNQMMARWAAAARRWTSCSRLGHPVRHHQSRGRPEVQDAVARAQRRTAGSARLAGPDRRTPSTRTTSPPARLTTSGCRCAARSPARRCRAEGNGAAAQLEGFAIGGCHARQLSGENIMKEFKPSGRELRAGHPPDRQVQDRLPGRRAPGQEGREGRRREEGREEAGREEGRRFAQGNQGRQHRGAVWRRRHALRPVHHAAASTARLARCRWP